MYSEDELKFYCSVETLPFVAFNIQIGDQLVS